MIDIGTTEPTSITQESYQTRTCHTLFYSIMCVCACMREKERERERERACSDVSNMKHKGEKENQGKDALKIFQKHLCTS